MIATSVLPLPRSGRLLIALAAALLIGVAPLALPVRAALPLDGVVIALDPGHNGGNAAHATEIAKKVWIGNGWKPCNQVGTSTRSGYSEHRFNFLVARAVRSRLEALGAVVRMTRTTDDGWGPCVDKRGKFGEKVGADLLLSIHADGASSAYRGFFVMKPGVVVGYTDDIAARSAVLARAMRRGLLDAGLPMANYYTTTGIKTRTNLGTLNRSDVPAVMVECGNMKNRSDAARMTTIRGRAQYADGLVAGIRRFLGR
ncbi:MAG: N-acetylmuramoyl-L-alanine amidase [Candidatus Limnocylindrales bacterium]